MRRRKKMVVNVIWIDEEGELRERLTDLEELKLFGIILEDEEKINILG